MRLDVAAPFTAWVVHEVAQVLVGFCLLAGWVFAITAVSLGEADHARRSRPRTSGAPR